MKTTLVNIKTTVLYFAILTPLMVACQSAVEPHETEILIDFSDPEFHTQLPSGLSIDMYELKNYPARNRLLFHPHQINHKIKFLRSMITIGKNDLTTTHFLRR
jgi:hypothetical protein